MSTYGKKMGTSRRFPNDVNENHKLDYQIYGESITSSFAHERIQPSSLSVKTMRREVFC